MDRTRIRKKAAMITAAAAVVISAAGCSPKKYTLNFDRSGFESEKTEYAAGETVTVYYDIIATDTDYWFFIDDDVEMKESYDNDHGYIFTFVMPDHDVTMRVESRNSMMYEPEGPVPWE